MFVCSEHRLNSRPTAGYFYNHTIQSPSMSNAENQMKVDYGILFDIDGVLVRGSNPLKPAIEGMRKVKDSAGNLTVPCAFVTNSCNRSQDKAKQLSTWLDMKVSADQVIQSQTPVKLLKQFHDKHVLVVGQDFLEDISQDLGFSKISTLDDVRKAYPVLDWTDRSHRRHVARNGYAENKDFPRIEAILLLSEPTHWESNLQLLIDLLLSEGKPTKAPSDPKKVPQLPVIACSMDLCFMGLACMPRFGNGAFLVCLEALYKKITGKDLTYSTLVGKPCEITYRFAEHTISKIAKSMGIKKPIKRLYFIGDNPDVDIYGANLYDRYLQKMWDKKNSDSNEKHGLPSSRHIPNVEDLHEQTVERCHSLLVGTGVYQHRAEESQTETADDNEEKTYHGHRDIDHEPHLTQPSKFVQDVNVAIDYILEMESAVLFI